MANMKSQAIIAHTRDEQSIESIAELDQIIFRRSQEPNLDQRESYLELLYDGIPHYSAAHMVGSTGRAFRGLRKRDLAFRNLCLQAEHAQEESREETVRGQLWNILLDTGHAKHWEAVKLAAETYLSETSHKRIRTVHQQIQMEGALAHTLQIPVDSLRSMPQEELDDLIQRLEAIEARPALRAVGE